MNLLIEFEDYYRSEFPVNGFAVMSLEEWNSYKNAAENWDFGDGGSEIYFGMNQCLSYSNFENFIEHFQVNEIDSDKSQFILNYFGYEYGFFPNIEVLTNCGEFLSYGGTD